MDDLGARDVSTLWISQPKSDLIRRLLNGCRLRSVRSKAVLTHRTPKMHIQRGFQKPDKYHGGWVTIGNFDGVHRGHQSMLATLVARAGAANAPAVVMTFDPHPIALLRPQQTPPALSLLDHKLELFAQHGIGTVVVYPTDHALLRLTPNEFFRDIVLGRLNASGLVEGPNFFFGHNRAGNVQTLRTLCDESNCSLEVVPAVIVNGRLISSSEIRSRIASGRISEAVEMLGHPHRVRGIVGVGAMRGRTIGFPTANLEGVTTLLPPDGVYAGTCDVGGKTYPAAINLGPNPTFGETARKFEAHLLGFAGDLYGQTLDVDLLARVRDVVRFESSDALKQQLNQDLESVRALANAAAGQ